VSQHQVPNCILPSEVLHQSFSGSCCAQQRQFNEIVHRNDANQLLYSVDVQHTIRKNSFSNFQSSEREMSKVKLGRRGKINSLTLSRTIFSWPSLEQS
jgi:hypothetical protein